MATHVVRARDKDTLASFLGWFSIGLGAAQVTAPRLMCRVVGASGGATSRRVMRLMGLRELTQGVGILTRPRPTAWLWSRVAGDGLDLALLGITAARSKDGRARTAFAVANVAAVAVPDVLEARHLSRKRGPVRAARLVRKAVTINRPRSDVEAAWLAAADVRRKVEAAGARVSFAQAPGDRGTELAVEFTEDSPAGDLGIAARKLAGQDLATQLSDDLRRLKQQVETGEVVRSEATPAGHRLTAHLKQRPAQPVEEATQ